MQRILLLCARFCTCSRITEQNTQNGPLQAFDRLSEDRSTALETLRATLLELLSSPFHTCRAIYRQLELSWWADLICPSADTACSSRPTNRIMILFFKWRRACLGHYLSQWSCSGMGSITARALFGGLLDYRPDGSWRAEMDCQPYLLDKLTDPLKSMIIRAGIRYTALQWYKKSSGSRFFTTKTNHNLSKSGQGGDTSTVPPYLHFLQKREKGEATAMYRQTCNVLNDKKCIGLDVVYATSKSTESKQDKRLTTAPDLVLEQAKDSFCPQASFPAGLMGSALTTTK